MKLMRTSQGGAHKGLKIFVRTTSGGAQRTGRGGAHETEIFAPPRVVRMRTGPQSAQRD